MSKVRMIQAVVEDKQKLLDVFPVTFKNPAMKEEQYLHHVTLFFGKPVELELDDLASTINNWAPEGEEVVILIKEKVTSMTFGVEALTVSLMNRRNEQLNIPNKVLHITASYKPERKPVDSNVLLSEDFPDKTVEALKTPLRLTAKIVHYK